MWLDMQEHMQLCVCTYIHVCTPLRGSWRTALGVVPQVLSTFGWGSGLVHMRPVHMKARRERRIACSYEPRDAGAELGPTGVLWKSSK